MARDSRRIIGVVGFVAYFGCQAQPQLSADDGSAPRVIDSDTLPRVVIPDTERRELESTIVDEAFKLGAGFDVGGTPRRASTKWRNPGANPATNVRIRHGRRPPGGGVSLASPL